MEQELDLVFYDERFIRLGRDNSLVVIPWEHLGVLSVFGGNPAIGLKDGKTYFRVSLEDWKRLEAIWPLFLEGHTGITVYKKDA
jgi:hypothetical protein